MLLANSGLIGGLAAGAFAVWMLLTALMFRMVVTTNSVHIVQSARKTTSYGRGQNAGNTYYRWPSWMPFVGVRVTILPVSIFDRKLVDYAAYDVNRVPFVIDVVGFFRISDSNVAAERVQDFSELEAQLEPILQGAARTILATSTIDEILGSRAVFSEKFTTEVTKDLTSWGVEPVKSIELMDIRDTGESQVIANIMAKSKSQIEMESRITVAGNMQKAQTAEIEAKQNVQLRQQDADQQVGARTAAKSQAVGIAQQKAEQAVQEEAALTAQKQMAVKQVQNVRAAEIDRDVHVVQADQAKQVAIVQAEGTKQSAIVRSEGDKEQLRITSEGQLASTTNQATGIQKLGEANANAAKLMQLAPVEAQITLAKEIGSNEGYQHYLISVRTVEANQQIGVAQAEALKNASVRIVATAANPAEGLSLARLGALAGGAIEAFKETRVSDTGGAKPNGGGHAAGA
jgi:flotillin